MKGIILVDMDDTITWLLPHWVRWLNEKYNLSVDWHDITQWDMAAPFPTLTKEQIYEPLTTEEIWDNVKPRGQAQKVLKELHDRGYEIYVCTSTDYRNIKPKYEKVIQKYFPFIDWKHIIVTSNKQLIHADFIVDDGIHNLINGNQTVKMLINMPHNQNFIAGDYGLIRVNDWSMVQAVVEEYSR